MLAVSSMSTKIMLTTMNAIAQNFGFIMLTMLHKSAFVEPPVSAALAAPPLPEAEPLPHTPARKI